jgi:hypothetical protein
VSSAKEHSSTTLSSQTIIEGSRDVAHHVNVVIKYLTDQDAKICPELIHSVEFLWDKTTSTVSSEVVIEFMVFRRQAEFVKDMLEGYFVPPRDEEDNVEVETSRAKMKQLVDLMFLLVPEDACREPLFVLGEPVTLEQAYAHYIVHFFEGLFQ